MLKYLKLCALCGKKRTYTEGTEDRRGARRNPKGEESGVRSQG